MPAKKIQELETLADLRRTSGVTQVELARRMDVSQVNVSRIEREGDLRISTLRRYVEALGGRLELRANFSDHSGRASGTSHRIDA